MAAAAWGPHIYYLGGVGGNTGTESILDVSSDLWCFDTEKLSWSQIQQAAPWPQPRRCPGWVSDGERLLLWGGSGIRDTEEGKKTYTFLNDWWRFWPDPCLWECVQPSDEPWRTNAGRPGDSGFPCARYTPVFLVAGDALFLFGGYTEDRLGKRKLNDAWLCRGGVWREKPARGPQGYQDGARWPGVRYGCMGASDGQRVYVCGGFSDEGDHSDLWSFDLAAEEWTVLSADGAGPDGGPAPRYCAAFTFFRQCLFLFGGRSRRHPKLNFNDLWKFDLQVGRWVQLHGNREPHEYGPSSEFPAYHAKAAVAAVGLNWYILGGEGRQGHVSDFWRLNLERQEWELLQPARPDDPQLW